MIFSPVQINEQRKSCPVSCLEVTQFQTHAFSMLMKIKSDCNCTNALRGHVNQPTIIKCKYINAIICLVIRHFMISIINVILKIQNRSIPKTAAPRIKLYPITEGISCLNQLNQ